MSFVATNMLYCKLIWHCLLLALLSYSNWLNLAFVLLSKFFDGGNNMLFVSKHV